MSLKRKLRALLVCLPLLLGSMSGVPMRPEQVEELMRTMNEQQVVQVIPGEKAPDEPLESATVNRGATLWFVEGPM